MATDRSRLADFSGNDIVVKSIQVAGASGAAIGTHLNDINGTTTSVTTTTTTLTAAALMGPVFVNSAATAVTLTIDTAANIVSTLNSNTAGANVGDILSVELINGGSSTGAITVGAGTGGSFDANVPAANKTVAINTAKTVFVKLTNVTSGSEAYTIFM